MANLDLPDLDELTPTPSAKAEEIESAVEEEKAVTFKKKKNKAEKTEPVKKEIESEED
jgi:hypothetical protein